MSDKAIENKEACSVAPLTLAPLIENHRRVVTTENEVEFDGHHLIEKKEKTQIDGNDKPCVLVHIRSIDGESLSHWKQQLPCIKKEKKKLKWWKWWSSSTSSWVWYDRRWSQEIWRRLDQLVESGYHQIGYRETSSIRRRNLTTRRQIMILFYNLKPYSLQLIIVQ